VTSAAENPKRFKGHRAFLQGAAFLDGIDPDDPLG